MSIFQTVDISALANAIDMGNRFVQLGFAYNAADVDDRGIVSMNFLDAAALPIGNEVLFDTSGQPTGSGAWSTASLLGAVPIGTRSIRLSLAAERSGGSGSARNISYDALSAQLLDGPPPSPPRDEVRGNLIQFTENGAWSWFQDERAVVDPLRGKLLVGSVANRDGAGGESADGWVKTTIFDLATGARATSQHKDLESYGAGDDHNTPAYLVLPNGDFLAIYAAHNHISNNGPYPNDGGTRMENYISYYRTYDVATGVWGAEGQFDWQSAIPANAPGAGGTTYSNLFHLSAENNGQGRIYNVARTQQSPHIMYSDDGGATWNYGGQLTKQADNPPSTNYVNGYFKYVSNGVDRIDFIATEFHPRDYNTSIYHGYIKNGRMYDSAGNEIDGDIFDAQDSFDPNSLPAPDDFTQIFQAGTTSNSRAWTTDVQSYPDGSVNALFKARAGGFGSHTTGANDHRVWFARLDPNTGQWITTEIARAGGQLFSGSETDYTGLGALHPNDPNTIYISTEVDPTSGATLPHHEIYKGHTSDDGQNWNWTAITVNSSFDNLRPIVPAWDEHNTAVLWWRGTMDTSHDYDTAVVGIIDRSNVQLAKTTYIDATPANTTLADASPATFTGPAAAAGPADGNWHQRTGTGNGNTVFTADESGAENTPMLKTSFSGLEPGGYDVFAFFWSDVNQDWQVEAGLAADELILFRIRGAQQAEAEHFDVAPTLDLGNMSLYRAYLGRVNVATGESVDVFIDDSSGSATQRAWYDGIGVAKVLSDLALLGDYNDDGIVDAADYTVWRDKLGTDETLPNDLIGGTISSAQYDQWKANFGRIKIAGNPSGRAEFFAVPELSTMMLAAFAIVARVLLPRTGH
jgi:hypothetical protein